jgi:hypothetical protein
MGAFDPGAFDSGAFDTGAAVVTVTPGDVEGSTELLAAASSTEIVAVVAGSGAGSMEASSGRVSGSVLELVAGPTPETPTVWPDLSGNGNDGTLENGPVWEGHGTHDDPYRLVFDGVDDYVDSGQNFNALTSFTNEAWCYCTGAPQSSFAAIINMDYWHGFALMVAPDGGSLIAYANIASTWHMDGVCVLSVGWHHITQSYRASDGLYEVIVDGTAYISDTTRGTPWTPTTTNHWQLGAEGASGYPLAGSIAVARLYPFALTADQVAQNFAAGLTELVVDNVEGAGAGSTQALGDGTGHAVYGEVDGSGAAATQAAGAGTPQVLPASTNGSGGGATWASGVGYPTLVVDTVVGSGTALMQAVAAGAPVLSVQDILASGSALVNALGAGQALAVTQKVLGAGDALTDAQGMGTGVLEFVKVPGSGVGWSQALGAGFGYIISGPLKTVRASKNRTNVVRVGGTVVKQYVLPGRTVVRPPRVTDGLVETLDISRLDLVALQNWLDTQSSNLIDQVSGLPIVVYNQQHHWTIGTDGPPGMPDYLHRNSDTAASDPAYVVGSSPQTVLSYPHTANVVARLSPDTIKKAIWSQGGVGHGPEYFAGTFLYLLPTGQLQAAVAYRWAAGGWDSAYWLTTEDAIVGGDWHDLTFIHGDSPTWWVDGLQVAADLTGNYGPWNPNVGELHMILGSGSSIGDYPAYNADLAYAARYSRELNSDEIRQNAMNTFELSISDPDTLLTQTSAQASVTKRAVAVKKI